MNSGSTSVIPFRYVPPVSQTKAHVTQNGSPTCFTSSIITLLKNIPDDVKPLLDTKVKIEYAKEIKNQIEKGKDIESTYRDFLDSVLTQFSDVQESEPPNFIIPHMQQLEVYERKLLQYFGFEEISLPETGALNWEEIKKELNGAQAILTGHLFVKTLHPFNASGLKGKGHYHEAHTHSVVLSSLADPINVLISDPNFKQPYLVNRDWFDRNNQEGHVFSIFKLRDRMVLDKKVKSESPNYSHRGSESDSEFGSDLVPGRNRKRDESPSQSSVSIESVQRSVQPVMVDASTSTQLDKETGDSSLLVVPTEEEKLQNLIKVYMQDPEKVTKADDLFDQIKENFYGLLEKSKKDANTATFIRVFVSYLSEEKFIENLNGEKSSDAPYNIIHACAECGSDAILFLVIKLSEKVREYIRQDIKSFTPLFLASEAGHVNCVELLLNQHAPVGAIMDNGETAIQVAAKEGRGNCLRLLLDQDHNEYEVADNIGMTALMKAAGNGHDDCVEQLLHFDVNQQSDFGYTALMIACQRGRQDVVETLLTHGASVDLKDSIGSTAFFIACKNGQVDCATKIINKKKSESINDDDTQLRLQQLFNTRNHHGRTAIMDICFSRKSDVLKSLLDDYSEFILLDQQDNQGFTALMVACYSGDIESSQYLIESGASVDIQRPDGRTALMDACVYGDQDIVAQLLDKGAKVDLVAFDGSTATSLSQNNKECRELLESYNQEKDVEARVENDVDVDDQEGRNLLQIDSASKQYTPQENQLIKNKLLQGSSFEEISQLDVFNSRSKAGIHAKLIRSLTELIEDLINEGDTVDVIKSKCSGVKPLTLDKIIEPLMEEGGSSTASQRKRKRDYTFEESKLMKDLLLAGNNFAQILTDTSFEGRLYSGLEKKLNRILLELIERFIDDGETDEVIKNKFQGIPEKSILNKIKFIKGKQTHKGSNSISRMQGESSSSFVIRGIEDQDEMQGVEEEGSSSTALQRKRKKDYTFEESKLMKDLLQAGNNFAQISEDPSFKNRPYSGLEKKLNRILLELIESFIDDGETEDIIINKFQGIPASIILNKIKFIKGKQTHIGSNSISLMPVESSSSSAMIPLS